MEKISRNELEQCYNDGKILKKKAEKLQELIKKNNKKEAAKLSEELKDCLGDHIILQIRVIDFINKIENPEMKKILTLHYIGMKPWDEVGPTCNKECVQKEAEQFLEQAFK